MPIDGVRKEVCRVTFLDVFQIKKKKIQVLQKKMNAGQVTVEEGRGKYQRSSVSTTAALKRTMKTHIYSQAIQPVHYSRKQNRNSFYLKPGLTIRDMYKSFCTSNPLIPNIDQKEKLFREVFADSGVGLTQPHTDTCKVCDRNHLRLLLATTLAEENRVKSEIDEHLLHADEGYRVMAANIQESRTNPNVVVKIIDLQQVHTYTTFNVL